MGWLGGWDVSGWMGGEWWAADLLRLSDRPGGPLGSADGRLCVFIQTKMSGRVGGGRFSWLVDRSNKYKTSYYCVPPSLTHPSIQLSHPPTHPPTHPSNPPTHTSIPPIHPYLLHECLGRRGDALGPDAHRPQSQRQQQRQGGGGEEAVVAAAPHLVSFFWLSVCLCLFVVGCWGVGMNRTRMGRAVGAPHDAVAS